MRLLLLMTALAVPVLAEVVLVPVPFEPAAQEMEALPAYPDGLLPGRAIATRPAEAAMFRIAWDGWSSVIVIGEGTDVRRPAWIATYDPEGNLAVAYRAIAYRDDQGILHIDGRKALISGPMASEWSPDSFALTDDGTVYTIDDMNRGNTGLVSETTDHGRSGYRVTLAIVQALVREAS